MPMPVRAASAMSAMKVARAAPRHSLAAKAISQERRAG
jgi:hypothetical protein